MRRAVCAGTALLIVFASLALAGSAVARPQAGVVITFTTHKNRQAFVAWALAPGWVPDVIAISSSPAVASDGSFFQENLRDGGLLDAGRPLWLTQWLSSYQLDYGTYYVRIRAHTTDYFAFEWSATAVLRIDATPPPPLPPPPAPPPPPNVKLKFRTIPSDRALRSVRMGQTVEVDAKVTGSSLSIAEWVDGGQFCLVRKNGPRCPSYGPKIGAFVTTVAPGNVVKGRLSAYAKLDDTVLARVSVPVRRS